ncbi:unnamed protein product [Anisakis simplex]|uniref:Uncharacterized protein n=1 Tax=Anisakis simplex TaxID=6269 RepID=A0A3P6NBF2_ANISI|nr:unnamed protein product [Anisakis simplex]
MFLAASEGHLEAVDLLLNSGASREVTDCQERSPKDVAMEKQFFDVANRLSSTQMNIPDKDNTNDDSLRVAQQRVPENCRKNLKKAKKLMRSNPRIFQRPLVKKIKPTSYQRIAPSEFLTPPQSDNSLTFFSPIQTDIPAGYAPMEPMAPWGHYEPGHGDISAEPQVPTHILSPPYETGAFVCSDLMPSYNDWREGVIRNSSVVNTTPTQQQQPQQLHHPYSLIPAAFALRRAPDQSIDQAAAFDHQLDQLEPGLLYGVISLEARAKALVGKSTRAKVQLSSMWDLNMVSGARVIDVGGWKYFGRFEQQQLAGEVAAGCRIGHL